MKKIFFIFLIIMLIFGFFGIKQIVKVEKAHQTFENYYAFRGCVQLVKRTNTYGICKLASDQTITLVKFHERWYLEGDLPTCFANMCW